MTNTEGRTSRITCQDCGGTVNMEVSWEHWGVECLRFECQGCGRAGQTVPEPFVEVPQ